MRTVVVATLAAITAAGGGYVAGQHAIAPSVPPAAASANGPVLYWRHPDQPRYAAEPAHTSDHRAYLPVRAGEDVSFDDAPATAPPGGTRKLLYYRNPMGLPDTSPVPKKDSMGMDYIPVYEGEEADDGAIRLSPVKVQKLGVQSEPAEMRRLGHTLRAPGTVAIDERRQSVVSLRFDAWIESVANVTTGDVVHEGQPLMRVYGPSLAADAAQYASVVAGNAAAYGPAGVRGARQRLENLAVPASYIATIERTKQVALSLDWPAPGNGIVLQRSAIAGMKAPAGEVLFRLADLSKVWVLADVSENDLPEVAPGHNTRVRPRGYPDRAFTGKVGLIYPQINKETRTARVRIELDNRDLVLRPDMYVEVEIDSGAGEPVLSVPDSAVIDSGTKQTVIVDRGEGRFEPKRVVLGRRGGGYVEVRDGIEDGDWLVVKANFLIDAESNLKSALRGLSEQDASR